MKETQILPPTDNSIPHTDKKGNKLRVAKRKTLRNFWLIFCTLLTCIRCLHSFNCGTSTHDVPQCIMVLY
jgi:hypothetical protein